MKNKGNLYLIPTPLGNIKDVTLREIEVLNTLDYLACEDTRNTLKLLNLLNIKKSLISLHEHNEISGSKKIIEDLLNGKNVGYASDAGLPCISDPGFKLVQECIKNNINIIPLPGPSASLTALIASGLDTSNFYFIGFLDPQISKKEATLKGFFKIRATLIFYESPHRIKETLASMQKIFGNRKVVIVRELTKVHEEFLRFNLDDYEKYLNNLIGEMVILVEGYQNNSNEFSDQEIINTVNELIKEGINKKDAIKASSVILKINKNYIKKLFID